MKKVVEKKRQAIQIQSLQDLQIFAEHFASTLHGGEVIALSGTLGAGKTTFVQLVGKALGVHERITSPTFTLMHVHPVKKHSKISHLVHIDAYRFESGQGLFDIGAQDYFGCRDTVVFIEWPERVTNAVPKDAMHLQILSGEKEEERMIVVG